jgi:VWFA-related protein
VVALLTCAAGAALLAQQQPPAQEPFRSGVDVIRIDVSVLDKNRTPVRGLTATDFVVSENGKRQRVVAVTEVDARAEDPARSAWMRLAEDDVARNNLADQVGQSQAIAIVMDDDHIPFDDSELAVATRDVARYVVESLGPSDSAAVIFPVRAGNTQDFTRDRSRLNRAIDTFKPQEEDTLSETYRALAPNNYNRVLGIDPCLQNEPLLTTLRAVNERLAAIPNRRKSILLLSTGSPVKFMMGGPRCQDKLYGEMLATFRLAQRTNVNIHGIDPGGFGGMEAVLMRGRIRNGRMVMPSNGFDAHQQVQDLHEFLKLYADQTGGRSVVDSLDVLSAIDDIFTESSLYYIVGYETSNPAPDGKFRRVDVKVSRSGLTVLAKDGYWAPDKDSVTNAANPRRDAPDRFDLNRSGMFTPIRLPLRATAQPVAAAADGSTTVAAVLAVQVPAPRVPVTERLSIVRSAINLDGDTSGPPVQETVMRPLEPVSGDSVWVETTSEFTLPPGRYEIRFEARSTLADSNGSVYAAIEVPDTRRCAICASGVVLGLPGDETGGARQLLPFTPTASREFARTDRVGAWMRVFQGGTAPPVAVNVTSKILDAAGAEIVAIDGELPARAFEENRSAAYRLDLPLDRLTPGPHVLSITATRSDGRAIRRDVVVHVR